MPKKRGLADLIGRERTEIVFEVVQGGDGRPYQTVVTESHDVIEKRKSLRTRKES